MDGPDGLIVVSTLATSNCVEGINELDDDDGGGGGGGGNFKMPIVTKFKQEQLPIVINEINNTGTTAAAAATAKITPTSTTNFNLNRKLTRKDSLSLLLEPESTTATMSSLLDLTQQDFEVNAPVTTDLILQGEDLLTALELNASI